jgi:hypothetical protein
MWHNLFCTFMTHVSRSYLCIMGCYSHPVHFFHIYLKYFDEIWY